MTQSPRRKTLAEHAQECVENQRRLKQEAAARREAAQEKRPRAAKR
jgi:hypothetical protein